MRSERTENDDHKCLNGEKTAKPSERGKSKLVDLRKRHLPGMKNLMNYQDVYSNKLSDMLSKSSPYPLSPSKLFLCERR